MSSPRVPEAAQPEKFLVGAPDKERPDAREEGRASLYPLAHRRLVEGTEVLRLGGGTTLTADQCNAILDRIGDLELALTRLSSHLSLAGAIDLMCSRSPVELRQELDARGQYAAKALRGDE